MKSYSLSGKLVPFSINSKTTHNPVVEGGAFLLLLLLLTTASALTIQVHDSEGFEIDVFNVNDVVYISAVSDSIPEIKISLENKTIEDDDMNTYKDNMFTYEFEHEVKGKYKISIDDKQTMIFVSDDFKANWDEIIEEKQKEDLQNLVKEVKEEVKLKQNIFEKIYSFLRDVLGIING